MKQIKDFDTIQAAGSFDRPAADGYVCVIRKAVDDPKGEYLALEFDIVEGKYKGYAAETAERAGFWPLNCRRYYGGKSIGFFKAFIEAVQNTNKNYKWNWDESTLVGKGIGIVFREEEYLDRNGNVRSNIKPYEFKTAAEIRDGSFTIPEPKRLAPAEASSTFDTAESDDDLPF